MMRTFISLLHIALLSFILLYSLLFFFIILLAAKIQKISE